VLDNVTSIINTLNSLPKVFGKIPTGAIVVIYDIITLVKSIALRGLTNITKIMVDTITQTALAAKEKAA